MSTRKLKILIADDDREVCELLERSLSRMGHKSVVSVVSPEDALAAVATSQIDVAIVDLNFTQGGREGLKLIPKIRERSPSTYVIVLSVDDDRIVITEAMKLGAKDYVVKEFGQTRTQLEAAFGRIAQQIEREHLAALVQELNQPAVEFVGSTQTVSAVMREIELGHRIDAKTFIVVGESGTGKEMVRRLIIKSDPRKLPATGINGLISCGTLRPETSRPELFGYPPKSGLPNADPNGKPGPFQLARGRFVTLDDFQHFPTALYPDLLQVLQNNEVTPAFGVETVPVEYKLIVTTQKPLQEMEREGRLTTELRMRLEAESMPINLSPLRERAEDIPLLARHFLKHDFLGKVIPVDFEDEVLDELQRLIFPGNVRELRNVVFALAARETSQRITKQTLEAYIRRPYGLSTSPPAAAAPGGPDAWMEGLTLEQVVNKAEAMAIARAVKKTKGSAQAAAQLLDVDDNTIYRKAKDYKIPLGKAYREE